VIAGKTVKQRSCAQRDDLIQKGKKETDCVARPGMGAKGGAQQAGRENRHRLPVKIGAVVLKNLSIRRHEISRSTGN